MHHRGLESIDGAVLREALARTPPQHYVIWTGRPLQGQNGSLCSRALACIREVGSPVSLRVALQRAAAWEETLGFDPDAVRNAVRRHQGAKPAVYLLVERLGSEDFVAVADIPFADRVDRQVRAGELLMDRTGAWSVGRRSAG